MNSSNSVIMKTIHNFLKTDVPRSSPNPEVLKQQSKVPADFFNDIRGVDVQPFIFNRIGVANTIYEIDKTRNIDSLYEYQFLEDNWDGEGAKKISKDVIFNVFMILHQTEFLRQPQLSPLATSGISMEFDLSRPYSLIIEIEEDVAIFSIVLNTKTSRQYFTGTISGPTEAQNIIYNFFEGKLPDGKTFKRVEQESHKRKR